LGHGAHRQRPPRPTPATQSRPALRGPPRVPADLPASPRTSPRPRGPSPYRASPRGPVSPRTWSPLSQLADPDMRTHRMNEPKWWQKSARAGDLHVSIGQSAKRGPGPQPFAQPFGPPAAATLPPPAQPAITVEPE